MDINGTIIIGQEIFKDLITLLNSYTRDQLSRWRTRVSCELYSKIGNFTKNIEVDL